MNQIPEIKAGKTYIIKVENAMPTEAKVLMNNMLRKMTGADFVFAEGWEIIAEFDAVGDNE